MSEKTQSERLRESLDKLGVEHEDADILVGEQAYGATTYWECGDVAARFSEKDGVGTLFDAWDVSPEQAIAATLGHTAKRVKVPYQSHVAIGHYECGACGQTVDVADRYCRKCGTRLVDE